jgi:hypothetical protein
MAGETSEGPTRLVGASLAKFLAGCVPRGVPIPDRAGPPKCGRCLATAEKDARNGNRAPMTIPEAERVRGGIGRVYYAANCANCTDLEWSKSWRARQAAARAKDDKTLLLLLDRQLEAWKARGRGFF